MFKKWIEKRKQKKKDALIIFLSNNLPETIVASKKTYFDDSLGFSHVDPFSSKYARQEIIKHLARKFTN